MSDDGLIVLRTVRNLLAGNGPVFNAGERVEANTSTLWQYLIYLVALVTDAELEAIATWLALIFTTAALVIAAFATAGLHRRHHALLLLPVSGLIYLALPPARDFATSGLEWGLSLLWIAVLWWLLVNWTRPKARGRHHAPARDTITYWLAFWCGLSWLVRPELALYGGLTGIVLLVTARSRRQGLGILAVALPVPAAYQIFRMGYYGLLTPHTAVAKSAADSAWADGWNYVLDLANPYWLWLALALALAMAAVTLWRVSAPSAGTNPAHPDTHPDPGPGGGGVRVDRMRLRTPAAVIALIVLCGLLHLIYVIRVGGDFMHGRMLLLPLFALLLPVAVIPVVDFLHTSRTYDLALAVGVIGIGWWTVATVAGGHEIDPDEYEGELGIVDERHFWTQATGREDGNPPRTAEDFRGALAMNDYVEVVERAREEDAGQMLQILASSDPETYSWITVPRMDRGSDLEHLPPTVAHVNLGFTSMNAPLDVRVLDTVGLATPLAARQPRDEDARVGHDKWLPLEWQAADTAVEIESLPPWVDREKTALARQALRTPEFAELFASYRAPLTPQRFLDNIVFSLTAGRTLEFSDDPRDYVGEGDGSLGEDGTQIAWPVDAETDPVR
ncbi:hypothetical protein A605_13120 [Corynebacterium halotolerans YIM 70093 = DSM 44683]|uniref:Terminal beta-(1->2)-arabinofuranosyltransferase C-terminal domain-containing protein n=2 Tax=Corynebacterium halotolerans TaxID=225326 RepID=M1P1E8_9CORY|nr:hypothetical protein A605_13120 [Corynebacterium halotolerans YIM 70093 = DSM 44683]